MLRNSALLCIAIFVSNLSFSQDVVFDKPLRLKAGDNDAYPVIDSAGNLVMFLFDRQNIHGVRFNTSFEVVSETGGERPKPGNMYDEVLGSSYENGFYHIFFASSNHKNFAAATFDFSTNKVTQRELNFPFKKDERYAASVSHNGTFYLITVIKPDILKVYALSDPGKFKARETLFAKQRYAENPKETLYYVLSNDEVVTIDNKAPVPLDIATKKAKLYAFDNSVVLTLDKWEYGTTVIKIDAKTLEATSTLFNQPSVFCGEDPGAKESNSYLHQGKLYQMKICSDQMTVTIADFETRNIINTFNLKRDGEFTFANTPVIQKGGYYDDERELSKPRQFLRKVSYSEAGISVVEVAGDLELTIGGRKDLPQNPGPMGMTPGMNIATPYGNFISPPVYNPTSFGYFAYKKSKSVHFKSLVDSKTYQHKEGSISENAFDKIVNFTEELSKNKLDMPSKKKISAESIFKIGNSYYLGYYSDRLDHYFIRKFSN